MKKNNLQFRKNIRCASHLIRFSAIPKIFDQSLSDHSYYVTYYVYKICKFLKLSKEESYKNIVLAVIHDIPEIVLGDIQYDVKHGFKEVETYFNILENNTIENRMKDIKDDFTNDTKSKIILKIADILDKREYIKQEIESGNANKEIKFIYKHTIEVQLPKLIKELKVNGKKLLDYVAGDF